MCAKGADEQAKLDPAGAVAGFGGTCRGVRAVYAGAVFVSSTLLGSHEIFQKNDSDVNSLLTNTFRRTTVVVDGCVPGETDISRCRSSWKWSK